MATARQTRRPASGVGLGVDASGGPVIDPTENVLALVDVEKNHARELREADNNYHEAMREWHEKFQSALREAETRRVTELSNQKQVFDLELAKVLRANQNDASTLLATQLMEVKKDLSDRTSKLEQYRWEAGGRGLGMNALAGYALSLIMAGIAAAAFFRPH